jgi:predicted transcriptional regulator
MKEMTWRYASGKEISLEIVTLSKIYSYLKNKNKKELTSEDMAFIPKFNQTVQHLVNERLLMYKLTIEGKTVYSITRKGIQFLNNIKVLKEALSV